MRRNLHGLVLILLMLIAGGSVKVWADMIVLELDATANETKTISLVTSGSGTIEVDWNVLDGAPNYATATSLSLQNVYSEAGVYTVYIKVSDSVLELNCSGQGINTIYLGGMLNVTKLNLSGNKLTTPMDLDANTKLEYLDYSNNGLINPMSLEKNIALKYLNLSNNKLGSSTAAVTRAGSAALDLTKNTALEELNLSNNGLNDERIPSLEKNVSLKKLDLSNNSFTKQIDLSTNTSLVDLNYSGNNLGALNVADLGSLKTLNVSGNTSLASLTIDNCTSLTGLDISETTQLGTISANGVENGQIYDFNSEGTGLSEDQLAEFENKLVPEYVVSLEVAGGINSDNISGEYNRKKGDYFYLKFFAEDSKLTLDDILFQIDGNDIMFKHSTDGTTGSYILNPIEADATITVALKEYSITLPEIEGLEISSKADTVAFGSSYTFSISSETLDLSEMKVLANGEELIADALRAESLSYTIDRVTDFVTITIEGIEGSTTANEEMMKPQLFVQQGAVQITTATPQPVLIYNINGVLKARQTVNGIVTIELAPGFYIVKINNDATKVIVQ